MKPFGHSRAPKKLKKRPHFDHFPRPWEIDPYMLYPAKYDLNVINILKCVGSTKCANTLIFVPPRHMGGGIDLINTLYQSVLPMSTWAVFNQINFIVCQTSPYKHIFFLILSKLVQIPRQKLHYVIIGFMQQI